MAFIRFSLDHRSLAAFRLLLGLALLCDLLFNKAAWFSEMYAADGIMGDQIRADFIGTHPAYAAWSWTLLDLFAADSWRWAIFAATIAAATGFMLGYRARVMGVLAFVGLWSIHQYNPAVLSGPDELLICMLFWSLFLPLETCLALRPRAAGTAGTLPAFAFLFQVALLYFFNAWLKQGASWQNGNAVFIALSEDYWRSSTATWLMQFPGLCKVLTYATRSIEYSIALLVLLPLQRPWPRYLAIFLMAGMHGTIAIFLNLGLFPLIILALCLALLPTALWEKWMPMLKPQVSGPTPTRPARRGLQTIALSALMLLFAWRNATRLHPAVPRPGFIQTLDQCSLLTQNWGFYAPEPSLSPAWFSFAGIAPGRGTLSLPSGQDFKPEPATMHSNISYTGGVYFYKTCVYDMYHYLPFRTAWPRYLLRKWNADTSHPPLQMVAWWSFSKRISPEGKILSESQHIVAQWPESTPLGPVQRQH